MTAGVLGILLLGGIGLGLLLAVVGVLRFLYWLFK